MNLDWARWLAARGLRIFPVYGVVDGHCMCPLGVTCDNTGKHPSVKEWQELATTDDAQLQRWSVEFPGGNTGVACGPSGLLVVDVDPRNGGNESLIEWENTTQWPLPATFTV